MEFPGTKVKRKRCKSRKRNLKNKRRVKRKLEVIKAATRRELFSQKRSTMRDEPNTNAMDAHTFWENYTFAQDWQQKHSVAWWRSRCHALEHENHVLKDKIRELVNHGKSQSIPRRRKNASKEIIDENLHGKVEGENEQQMEEESEEIEFQVNEDLLSFLEQSVRHKMELKRLRELASEEAEAENAGSPFVSSEARMLAKVEDARLLYGESSPRIMAMEAALQATMDRHKDRAKPQYWPNIPLKL